MEELGLVEERTEGGASSFGAKNGGQVTVKERRLAVGRCETTSTPRSGLPQYRSFR